jgi:acyl dehydratase
MVLRNEEIRVGQSFEQIVARNLNRVQFVRYAGASGDYNPAHIDEVFAREVAGLPSVLAHGMLTMGLTARMLTDQLGDASLVQFGGRFRTPVWPGDTLQARAEVAELASRESGGQVQLQVVTTNQNGEQVFIGYARALVD